MTRRKFLMIALVLWSLTLHGCANLVKVEAFEKGDLAKEEMTFGGNPLEAKFHEHIYNSKESASGGSGIGGGGCGCN
jgi:hypothetical protein